MRCPLHPPERVCLPSPPPHTHTHRQYRYSLSPDTHTHITDILSLSPAPEKTRIPASFLLSPGLRFCPEVRAAVRADRPGPGSARPLCPLRPRLNSAPWTGACWLPPAPSCVPALLSLILALFLTLSRACCCHFLITYLWSLFFPP